MAEILLFRHAMGRTPGALAFADSMRRAGHTVHTPDLYAGRVFDRLEDGVAHAQRIGMDEIIDRGTRFAQQMPSSLMYAGISLDVLPAQKLAMTGLADGQQVGVGRLVEFAFDQSESRPRKSEHGLEWTGCSDGRG